MINENVSRPIGAAGRVSFPKKLREKYSLMEGVNLDIFSLEEDGETYLCFKLPKQEEEKVKNAKAILEAAGYTVDKED